MAWGGDKDKEDGSRFSIGSGTRRGSIMGGGSSTGPIEEPFGYSKQQRPAGTLSPPRIRFPGNHLLLLEAIARHNGQVIHPLRLLARETATRPRQPLVFSIASTRQRKTNTRLRTTVPLVADTPPAYARDTTQARCVHRELPCAQRLFLVPVNRPPPPRFS